MTVTETKSAVWSARDWAQAILPYRRASAARGIFELIVTFPPFVAIWTAMMIASSHGQFWLSFALAPLAAGLLIRLFLIQHDCGHGSFLPSKLANDWVGRAIGVLIAPRARQLLPARQLCPGLSDRGFLFKYLK